MMTTLRCPECFTTGHITLDPDPEANRVTVACACGYWTQLEQAAIDRWFHRPPAAQPRRSA